MIYQVTYRGEVLDQFCATDPDAAYEKATERLSVQQVSQEEVENAKADRSES